MYHAELETEVPQTESSDGKEYKTFLDSRPKEMENKAIQLGRSILLNEI
jgi:hypothetical protein